MKITVSQVGKTYEIGDDNVVKVTHNHDAIVSVCGEYFKNKYTGEWLSEVEVQDYYDAKKLDEEYENKYY